MTALAAALSLASCNVEESIETGANGLTITLDSGALATKAGDDAAPGFETEISYFDYFFFEDAEGTTPMAGLHGRVEGTSKTFKTGLGEEFEALRSVTSYVYMVANYPRTIDHTRNWTLADLRALNFTSTLVTTFDASTGQANYASSLVMDSYDAASGKYTVELTPRMLNEQREVTVGLSRIAAKLTMKINVPKKVDAKEEGATWTPVVANLQAYFVNALNSGTKLNGEPVRNGEDDPTGLEERTPYRSYPDYFHYTRIGESDDPYVFETDPVYTYPQTWTGSDNGDPYFKIYMTWMHSVNGTSNFYYKVVAPKPENGVFTIERNTWYKLTVDLSVVDTADEYIELDYGIEIAPWGEAGFVGGSPLSAARFFKVSKTEYDLYSQDEVSIPFSSSSTVKAFFKEISYTHYRVGTGTTYTFNYTDENTTKVTLPTIYDGQTITPVSAQDRNEYKLTVDGKNVIFSHPLSNIYTVREVKFEIKNQDGASEIVTVRQHPAIEVKSHPTNNAFVNGHFARATEGVHVNGSTHQKMGVPFVLHYSQEAGQTRYHSDDNEFPDGNSYDDPNGYWFYPGDNYQGGEKSNPLIISNVTRGRYGWLEGDVSRSVPYLIEFTVSAFNENNNSYTINENGVIQPSRNYILGDPRKEGGTRFSTLAGYLYKSSTLRNEDGTTTTGEAEYRAWEEPMKILIASTEKNDGVIIAPRFIVSSFYNAQPSSLTYENCLKRAATYQEAGYPAGRWRLPTEAEIMFMVQQQINEVIPPLWGSTSRYWCADGRYVDVGTSGSIVSFNTPASAYSTFVNRFVYDTWYWGDEPLDEETYWPNMHLVTPNQN